MGRAQVEDSWDVSEGGLRCGGLRESVAEHEFIGYGLPSGVVYLRVSGDGERAGRSRYSCIICCLIVRVWKTKTSATSQGLVLGKRNLGRFLNLVHERHILGG